MRPRIAALAALPLLVGAAARSALAPRVGEAIYCAATALEARRAKLRTRTVDVDGLAMVLHEGGPVDAPTLVLLHGFSADRGIWSRFASRFVRDFHVIVPDLAGHGDTPFVAAADHSAFAQADRVARLLDALAIDRAHVLGNSMGGNIAACFAISHPQRTLSVGLCDAAGVESPQPSPLDLAIRGGNGNPFLLDHPDQFDAFYAMTMARPPFVPGFARRVMARSYVSRREQLEQIFADIRPGSPLEARLGEIAAPTLVLWGARDQLIDVSAVAVWEAGIADVRTHIYDDDGHMPMIESPERTARDYRAFLDSL